MAYYYYCGYKVNGLSFVSISQAPSLTKFYRATGINDFLNSYKTIASVPCFMAVIFGGKLQSIKMCQI